MIKKDRAKYVIERLKELYPEAICSLDYSTDYELLFAVRLSAQCTDARVNIVTKDLFKKYQTLEDYANANIKDVEEIVKPCGFYKNKASSIVNMAQMILNEYDGKIPDTIDELVKLPGVGRKTANLIVGDIFGKESIVVDTHMIRIANRIGLVKNRDPHKIEIELKKIVPKDEGSDFCHRIVLFGRDVCTARKPKCDICKLRDYCKQLV